MDGSLLFGTKLDTSGLKNGLGKIGSVAASTLGVASKAVAAVSAGLSAGTAASVKFGSQFETSFAKASTLFGDVSVDTDNLNKKILEMSSVSGIAASDLNETLYQAMSAGIPVTEDMAEALGAVDTANKLAVGGYTASSTAMGALTTAINAYGLSADDATQIADELITVQNKGVTTVDELASNMGKAIATGSAYGVNLENLNAGYIALTKSGISTAESTTYMASMFNELGDSGSDVSAVLQEKTGMTFGELMNSGASLADVMDILSESVDGNSEALINLWGSAEAGKAANAIVQQGTDAFRQSLDDLANSAGATETAYDTMMDTFEGKKDILTESAKNLGIAIYEGVQNQASGMLDVANEYISQLQTGFEENGSDGLIQAFGNIISDLVGRAADFAPQIIELAIQIIGQLGQALVENAPEILESVQEIIDTVLESIGDLCPEISPLTDMLQAMIDNFDELVPYIEAATTAFLVFKAGMAITSIISGVSSAISGMVAVYSAAAAAEEGLTVAQWLLNAAMNANVISIIVIALAALVAAFIYLWNTSDSFREFWIDLWDNIYNFFSDAWNGIVNFCTQTIPNLISNIGTWFSQLPEKIAYFLGYTLTKIVAWAIQMPIKATEAGKNFLESVIKFFKELPDKAWTFLLNTVTKAAAFAVNLALKAKEAGEGFIEKITSALSDLPGKMGEIGGNIVAGIWNGISGGWNWLVDKVKNLANSLFQGAKDALDINSPSKKFAWIGKMCIEGFDQPFEKYNPYDTLANSMKVNKGTLRMNYLVGTEVYQRSNGFDYERFGKAAAYALEKSGLTISVDKRPFGRIVREVTA